MLDFFFFFLCFNVSFLLQLELRDVDSGSKQSLRFGTEESVESIYMLLPLLYIVCIRVTCFCTLNFKESILMINFLPGLEFLICQYLTQGDCWRVLCQERLIACNFLQGYLWRNSLSLVCTQKTTQHI